MALTAVTVAAHRGVPLGSLALLPRIGRWPPQADTSTERVAARPEAGATQSKDLG